MLVEFRVKNFRSLRDEQVFSMVASADKSLAQTHTVDTGLKAVPQLLRAAVVYGANASGKSSLVRALQFMKSVVLESALMAPNQAFAAQPFRLDEASRGQPSEFEVTFILDGVRYQYGFALTARRVVREHLLVYKAFKPQRWFERWHDPEQDRDVYEFGTGMKGARHLWEKSTRSNALFLSTAVQLNSESLRPVFDWFSSGLMIFNELTPPQSSQTIRMLGRAEGKQQIRAFLAAADISIDDIEVVTPGAQKPLLKEPLPDEKTVQTEDGDDTQLRLSHVTPHGKAVFELDDESAGTRSLLMLAGPVLDILKKGQTLVIDELDTSLHTLLVRELVRLFLRPEINTGGAQLIFTTHDTSLLDAEDLFRRDQIWLVEKGADQASSLVALVEFSPRKNEALERGYLMGRYGGVPFLGDYLEAMH